MQQIEILKIENPFDFWITEKDTKSFLDMVDEEIRGEEDGGSCGTNFVDPASYHTDMIVAVYLADLLKWYRAKVIGRISSFRGRRDSLRCFLIDVAETITVNCTSCREIKSLKLKKLPALAKKCSLIGIEPATPSLLPEDPWRLEAIDFFKTACRSKSKYYAKYPENTNQINLYTQLSYSEDKASSFISLNELMVSRKYAKFTQKYQQQVVHSSKPESISFAEQHEQNQKSSFYNVNILKAHLKAKSSFQNDSDLVEELFKENNDYLRKQPDKSDTTNSKSVLAALTAVPAPSAMKSMTQPHEMSSILVQSNNSLKFNQKTNLMRKVEDLPNEPLKLYLKLKGIKFLSVFDSYCWATLFRGNHLFAMPYNTANTADTSELFSQVSDANSWFVDNTESPESLMYIAMMVSLLIDKVDTDIKAAKAQNCAPSAQTGNGPKLLIICASCKNAKKIFELTNEILEISEKAGYLGRSNTLKALLLQGGGHEDQYEIPLINGCDILICATPFCLLRMLGHRRTNLERLQYMVIDEAHLVFEKFPRQIRVLMAGYYDLLKLNEKINVANFVLCSSLWSAKLKSFIRTYMLSPVMIMCNKLEASYFGQTEHTVIECGSSKQKKDKFLAILQTIKEKKKNTIVFTNKSNHAVDLYNFMTNELQVQIKISLIVEQTSMSEIREIQDKWLQPLLHTSRLRILICEESMSKFLEIDNAQAIIHYDFPSSKTIFGNRLWFMRKHFSPLKEESIISSKESTSIGRDVNDNVLMDNKNAVDNLTIKYDNEISHLVNDEDRLCSFILFTKEDKNYSEGLINFFLRIGHNKKYIPPDLLRTAEKRSVKTEAIKVEQKFLICPYVKKFGKCMEHIPSSCVFRHKFDPVADKICSLDDSLMLPSEGLVKFKVCHVDDANHIYINLISHENLRRDHTTNYDQFSQMDLELQLYYSNASNVKEISTKFEKNDMYAFKDISNNLYKRISILEVINRDNNIAYEIIVNCIDYGTKLKLHVFDLIRLPSRFKRLPAQAVEVFFCDIRPIDLDLNWSVAAKIFIAEKLQQSKEFVGKIQLAAGNTLWLHPISSFKYLKELNLSIVDDCVRNELVQNNYGIEYPNHLRELKKSFTAGNLQVSRVEDEEFQLTKNSDQLLNAFYDDPQADLASVSYAHLDMNSRTDAQSPCKVFLSTCDNPKKFWIQNEYSNKLLNNLNTEMNKFMSQLIEKQKDQLERSNWEISKPSKGPKSNEKTDLEFEAYIKRKASIQRLLSQQTFDRLQSQSKAIFCLAKMSSEDEFNRARVVSCAGDEVQVFFVDFGDHDWIKREDVFPIPGKFLKMLPFQAVEVSLAALADEQIWSRKCGDDLWSLTHDADNCFCLMLASVISFEETTEGFKRYAIDLFQPSCPELVNVAHRLVAMGSGRLSEAEECRLFELSNCESGGGASSAASLQVKALTKQFVNTFIRCTDYKKQCDLITILQSRFGVLQLLPSDAFISSGFLQTLSKSLAFISKENLLTSLIKYLRKLVLSTKDNATYVRVFCESNGLGNLFFILSECQANTALRDLILTVLVDFSDFTDFKAFMATNENYLQVLWKLIPVFDYTEAIDKILVVLENIVGEVGEAIVSLELKHSIESITKNCKNQLLSNAYHIESTASKYLLKAVRIVEPVESDNEDEEKKEKFRDLLNYICSMEADTGKGPVEVNPVDSKLVLDRHSKPVGPTSTKFLDEDSPAHTSDEEIDNQFIKDLAKLFNLGHLLPKTQNGTSIEASQTSADDQFKNKPYKYPRILWDQTNEQITMKVLLRGVKAMELNYGSNSVSFRTLLSGQEYGFDFDLFAAIDSSKCRANTSEDKIVITIQKAVVGIWTRLLSSQARLRFIKSEYNNLESSSDEESVESDGAEGSTKKKRKKKSKFSEFLSSKNVERKHLGEINVDSGSTTKTSDSSSDFDGQIYNDLDNDKDVYWD